MSKGILIEAYGDDWENAHSWDIEEDEASPLPKKASADRKEITPPENLKSPSAIRQSHTLAKKIPKPPESIKEILVKGREARQRVIDAVKDGKLKIGQLCSLEDLQKITGLNAPKTMTLVDTFQEETAGFIIKEKLSRHGDFLGFRITSGDIDREKQLEDFCNKVKAAVNYNVFSVLEITKFSKSCGFDNPNYLLKILIDANRVEKLARGQFRLVKQP